MWTGPPSKPRWNNHISFSDGLLKCCHVSHNFNKNHTIDGLSLFLNRCDDKTFRRLMSKYGNSRSKESCSAVLELLERVTRLHKQLQLKERQAEIDMDQVPSTAEGSSDPLLVPLGPALLHQPFVAVRSVLN